MLIILMDFLHACVEMLQRTCGKQFRPLHKERIECHERYNIISFIYCYADENALQATSNDTLAKN